MSGSFDIDKFWAEQADMQQLFERHPPSNYEGRTELTKDMVVHLMTECAELLRAAGAWKFHRRIAVPENQEAIKLELADIFKFWMILCQAWSFTPDEMATAIETKSMIVRQRYSQEWVQSLEDPCVVVDIDGVLADYVTGFLRWGLENGHLDVEVGRHLLAAHPNYLSAEEMGLTPHRYSQLKHQARVSDMHRHIEVMPGAQQFLDWCRAQNWRIVLLTARPIDQYPNLHGDTLVWLRERRLPYDQVWWAPDKGQAILSMNPRRIVCAVDDESVYVKQMREVGVHAFHFNRHLSASTMEPGTVRSFGDLITEVEHGVQR